MFVEALDMSMPAPLGPIRQRRPNENHGGCGRTNKHCQCA
jgi:hypothetical protein